MRFLSMVKMNEAKMTTTPKAMMDAINAMVEEAAKDGCVMVQGVGLLPTSSGMRARLAGGKLTLTDGPFTEAKEVVGGYAIFECASKAQMRKWTERFMELHKHPHARLGRRVRSAPDPRSRPGSLRPGRRAPRRRRVGGLRLRTEVAIVGRHDGDRHSSRHRRRLADRAGEAHCRTDADRPRYRRSPRNSPRTPSSRRSNNGLGPAFRIIPAPG